MQAVLSAMPGIIHIFELNVAAHMVQQHCNSSIRCLEQFDSYSIMHLKWNKVIIVFLEALTAQ